MMKTIARPARCLLHSGSIALLVAAAAQLLPVAARADAPSQRVLQAEQARVAAIDRATRSTVGVFSSRGEGGGSGVIISPDGYVLTNFHVASPFGHEMRCGLSDGRMFDAIVVGIDPTGDLALLKMFEPFELPSAVVADSDTVRQGDLCFAAGNPFVLATNLEPTVTWGIVSGVHRYQYPDKTILEYADCIQTDAAINPGNSGGPLYNAAGELIGINGRCSFEKRGRVNVGVGYAISSNQAMLFLKHLKSGRIVDHATLGFTATTDTEGRVVVSNILESSDAFRRGLRYDDEILSLGGREIASVNELKNALGIYPAGYRVPIAFRRGERTLETWIRLDALHTSDELLAVVDGDHGPEGPEGDKVPEGETPGEGSDEAPKEPKEPKQEEETGKAERRVEGDPADANAEGHFASEAFERYEERAGYGNLYFQGFEFDRIVSLRGDVGSIPAAYDGKIVGETTTVGYSIEGDTLVSSLADQTERINVKRGWSQLVESRSPHALAIALHLRRQWLTLRPEQLGAAVYVGGNVVPGEPRQHDWTHVTAADVEADFYTDGQTGELRLIELAADPGQDRFECYFDATPPGGPGGELQVRCGYGIENLATIRLNPSETVPADESVPADAAGEQESTEER